MKLDANGIRWIQDSAVWHNGATWNLYNLNGQQIRHWIVTDKFTANIECNPLNGEILVATYGSGISALSVVVTPHDFLELGLYDRCNISFNTLETTHHSVEWLNKAIEVAVATCSKPGYAGALDAIRRARISVTRVLVEDVLSEVVYGDETR